MVLAFLLVLHRVSLFLLILSYPGITPLYLRARILFYAVGAVVAVALDVPGILLMSVAGITVNSLSRYEYNKSSYLKENFKSRMDIR